MQGHLSSLGNVPTPVVAVAYDDENEQFSDPTKVVSYNFFQRVAPGAHLIEVMVAAGSGIDVTNYSTVSSPVLTLDTDEATTAIAQANVEGQLNGRLQNERKISANTG